MSVDLKSTLEESLSKLQIELNEQQTTKLISYLQQLQRWNKTYNLTAIESSYDMLLKHVVDSLTVLPILDGLAQQVGTADLNILDVGSGGGLPGIVIAVCREHWTVTCVDAVQKKIAFIQQMRAVLNCPNLHAVHSRIERAKDVNCDVLITRAFSSLKNTIEWAGKHITVGGYLVAMKGKEPTDELAELQLGTEWLLQPIQPVSVPFLDAERCVVMIKKQGKQ